MISERLSHVDAAQAALLDIERRRLSTSDMYQHALLTMSKRLDRLMSDLHDNPTIGGAEVAAILQTLLHNTFNALTPQPESASKRRSALSTSDIDLKLIGYSSLRDGISGLYRNHHGRDHADTCVICLALWECAGMISAVERINTGKMAVARHQVQTLYKGQLSHRASVVPVMIADKTHWRATCPTCGTLATLPGNRFQETASMVTKHRRAAAALMARNVKPS